MSGMKAIPSEENNQVCLVIYEPDDSD